jgi:multicomponent K+:H+ antiporter subunit F
MNLSIIEWALGFAIIATGLGMVLCTVRLLRGPEQTDRVLALDTMYINVTALVVLLGMAYATELFFEAALIIALLGFASTVALSRYLSRGDVIE